MNTGEILKSLTEKFKAQSELTSEIISYPNIQRVIHSFAFRPPNLFADIDNIITNLDKSDPNTLCFKIDSLDQAINVIDKYFNFKHSSYKDFLEQYVLDQKIDVTKNLYLKFYLTSNP